MKILLDMQGAQTSGSRNRGIGRYSLSFAEGILRNRGKHEVHLLFNGAFGESITEIRDRLDRLIDEDRMHLVDPIGTTRQSEPENRDRRICSEILREAAIARINPDIVHLTSHFEGFGDEAVSSIGRLNGQHLTSVTLYDLIPYIHRDIYLANPLVRAWYEDRIAQLRKADLLLSISASSGREAVDYLGVPEERVVNVSTAADPQFRKRRISPARRSKLLGAYGIRKRFVMYTGGIDYRKNVEQLILAYARVEDSLRTDMTLAIVCSCADAERERLSVLARSAGLGQGEITFTGFVPDDDLVDLYSSCELFVFPSWHEGFGLPVLEAMSCGAPVISSNRSSLPEVVGRADALFDPTDVSDIASAIERVLSDSQVRDELTAHSDVQAAKFSWDATARLAIASFEEAHASATKAASSTRGRKRRPRLAYVSPLPPARSGIADYSAEILPELARHYDIDVVIQQGPDFQAEMDPALVAAFPVRTPAEMRASKSEYERVLYHFGNSDHHGHMTELIRAVPGVVVLHDFYLSGLFAVLEHRLGFKGLFSQALFDSHGFGALEELDGNRALEAVMWKYPCNRPVIDRALGVIVHSRFAAKLADEWYGPGFAEQWRIVPLPRAPVGSPNRTKSRTHLGFSDDEFLVVSFGGIGETKLSHRLLEAFLASELSKHRGARLVLVGAIPETPFGEQLQRRIDAAPAATISVTGWASLGDYRHYLASADVAVQLRALSRGETSAAVLDCLNHGVPTILNANGSMAEFRKSAVVMLDDEFKIADLAAALDQLHRSYRQRRKLSIAGPDYVRDRHSVRSSVDQYREAIEQFYTTGAAHPLFVAEEIGRRCTGLTGAEMKAAAASIEAICRPAGLPRTFLDVGGVGRLSASKSRKMADAIRRAEQLSQPVIPVSLEKGTLGTRNKDALNSLGLDADLLDDHDVALAAHDRVLVVPGLCGNEAHLAYFKDRFADVRKLAGADGKERRTGGN